MLRYSALRSIAEVWHGTVWCGMAWYIQQCGMVQDDAVRSWHGMADGMAKTTAESRLSHNRTEPSQG